MTCPGWSASGSAARSSAFRVRCSRSQFDRARAAGLHSVPHAGETTGPETIWDAVRDLGAERIEHGIGAVRDRALLTHLAETRDHRRTSARPPMLHSGWSPTLINIRSASWSQPGVPVTINTDDPPMFGTDLNTEYAIAARLLDLDERGVTELARAAVDASFARPDARSRRYWPRSTPTVRRDATP